MKEEEKHLEDITVMNLLKDHFDSSVMSPIQYYDIDYLEKETGNDLRKSVITALLEDVLDTLENKKKLSDFWKYRRRLLKYILHGNLDWEYVRKQLISVTKKEQEDYYKHIDKAATLAAKELPKNIKYVENLIKQDSELKEFVCKSGKEDSFLTLKFNTKIESELFKRIFSDDKKYKKNKELYKKLATFIANNWIVWNEVANDLIDEDNSNDKD